MRARRAHRGFTILEVAITAVILLVMTGATMVVFGSMTRAVATGRSHLVAQTRADAALMEIASELQTSDLIGTDASGEARIKILDHAGRPDSRIQIKKVTGYAVVGAGQVKPEWSQWIDYMVTHDGELQRTEGPDRRILTDRVTFFHVRKTPGNLLEVILRVRIPGAEGPADEVERRILIGPKNGGRPGTD